MGNKSKEREINSGELLCASVYKEDGYMLLRNKTILQVLTSKETNTSRDRDILNSDLICVERARKTTQYNFLP